MKIELSGVRSVGDDDVKFVLNVSANPAHAAALIAGNMALFPALGTQLHVARVHDGVLLFALDNELTPQRVAAIRDVLEQLFNI